MHAHESFSHQLTWMMSWQQGLVATELLLSPLFPSPSSAVPRGWQCWAGPGRSSGDCGGSLPAAVAWPEPAGLPPSLPALVDPSRTVSARQVATGGYSGMHMASCHGPSFGTTARVAGYGFSGTKINWCEPAAVLPYNSFCTIHSY